VPCLDGGPTLESDALAAVLAELPNGEVIDGRPLHRRLSFADVRVGWGYVAIDLYSHKADGLTRADTVLAAKLNGIAL
jgi:4a-hydroxytetrahydrobiopterin dehydratase